MNPRQDWPGLAAEPADLALWLPRGVAVPAAAPGGLGVVMWIAANWESMGRVGHFALLQGLHSLTLLLLSKPSSQFKGQVFLLRASRKSSLPCKIVMATISNQLTGCF